MCSLGFVLQSGALIWLNYSLQITAVPYASSFRCFLFLAKVIDFMDEAICARLNMRCGKCGNVLMSYFTYFSPTVVRKQWASSSGGTSPDQCGRLPLKQATRSCFQKYALESSNALNSSRFESYNFTYSIRQVASKQKTRMKKKKTPLTHFPLCQQVLSSRGRQRGILVALRWINTECSCVLSRSVTLSFTQALSGYLVFEVPLTDCTSQEV